ncbi:MAG: transpeptidase family protein [Marinilabiliaceae bacterium]|nr:transpeptidase family protein [Marinilabiliaceae bacterium]
MKIKKDILWRIGIVYLAMVVLSLYILFQMFRIQFVQGDYWRAKVKKQKVEDVIIDANRGSILSDDGRILSCSVPGYYIYMDTRANGLTDDLFYKHVDSLSIKLSRFFGDKSASAYKSGIVNARKRGNRYYKVSHRMVSIIELNKIKNFPIFRLGSNKGGFISELHDTRNQPFGSLAVRTVGKVSIVKDSLGQKKAYGNGLEVAYNKDLMGVDGVGEKTKIGVRWVHDVDVEPIDGDDILTTLNVEIQDVAEQSLREQLIRHNARYGVAVVMEVKTGDIKAMVNLQRSAPGYYVEDHYNYAIGVGTEPGSTFKLASMIVALEDGKISLDDTVDTEDGTTRFYDRIMRDAGHSGGLLSVKDVFENSSNVGVSKLIFKHYKNNPKEFIEGLYDLGITQKLGISIPGEASPYIKNPDDKTWSGVTLPWMSIGYESRLTPLQILSFYNAVANDGRLMRPRFVKGVWRHNKLVKRYSPEVVRSSICSATTLKKVRLLLEGVVENGTANNIKNTNYQIAGKTGTAQIAQGTRGYKIDGVSYQASFVGYFPAQNPKYSCIVVVNGPSNNVYYGNVVAGSVFKTISDRLYAVSYKDRTIYNSPQPVITDFLPYSKGGVKDELIEVYEELDMKYVDHSSTDWVSCQAGNSHIDVVSKRIEQGVVPNVKGLGAKDAVALLEKMGMKVFLTGVGRVIEQSVNPGSLIKEGAKILLKLG